MVAFHMTSIDRSKSKSRLHCVNDWALVFPMVIWPLKPCCQSDVVSYLKVGCAYARLQSQTPSATTKHLATNRLDLERGERRANMISHTTVYRVCHIDEDPAM